MTEDVSAGRLHIEAYADTSGFAAAAKSKIEAATKGLRAKIKVELDDRGVITQAKASAAKAQKAASVRIKASLDTRGLAAEAKAAAALASKAARIKVAAGIDQAQFRRDLTTAVAAMQGRYTVKVGVDVDTGSAQAKMAAFRASQSANPINLGLNLGGSGGLSQLGTLLTQLGKFPAIAGGIFMAGSALAQLTGGLFAVASAASQAVTTVAALPNLLGMVGQGIGVLVAGFSGIGDAVSALGKADAGSAAQTASAASTRQDSARRVADAQQNLANAYRAAADAARQAKYAVSDAEWALARAHEAAAEAQENLNEARQQARENLDELNDSLERAALTEELAANNLQKAKQALQDVLWDNSASAQERRDAELAVQQAQQDLKDARDDHNDLAKETAEANEAGVRGSEQMEDARDALRDANHNVMLSERALAEARRQAANTARSNAQMIADAQQAVRDAQQSGTDAIGAQNMALSDQMEAFNKLTPAAQRFARFLFDTVMPRFATLRDNIQEAILPPIQEGITRAMPFIDTLEEGLLGTADIVGRLAVDLGTLLGSETFNDEVAQIMDSNNRAMSDFGDAGLSLIRILARIARVAGPTLVEPFAEWVKTLTASWEASLLTQEGTEGMRDRFIRAREALATLARIIGNVVGALFGMGQAAIPAGNDLLGALEGVTQKWEDWANSTAGQDRMREFFEAAKPVTEEIGRLIVNLSQLFIHMGDAGGGPVMGFLQALNWLVEGFSALLLSDLGPVIGQILVIGGAAGGIALVAGMVLKMAGAFMRLAPAISGIGALLTGPVGWIALLAAGLGILAWRSEDFRDKMVGAWERIKAIVLPAIEDIKSMIVDEFIPAFEQIWPKLEPILTVLGGFILDSIVLAISGVVQVVKAIVQTITGMTNVIAGILTGDWRQVLDGLMQAFGGMINQIIGIGKVFLALGFGKIFTVIGRAFRWLVNIFRKGGGGRGIGGVLSQIGNTFSWLWHGIVKPYMKYIAKAVRVAWGIVGKVFRVWWGAVQVGIRIMGWLWSKAVQPVLRFIGTAFRVAWAIIRPIFDFWMGYMRLVGTVIGWLWRNAVQPAMRGILAVIRAVWPVIRGIFIAIRAALRTLGSVFSWLWRKIIVPVWKGIRKAIDKAWDAIRAYFRAAQRGVRVLGDVFSWLWRKIIVPVWNGIRRAIAVAWGVIRGIFRAVEKALDTLGSVFSWLWRKIVVPVWDGIKRSINTVWTFIRDRVFDPLIKLVRKTIPDAFEAAKRGIATTWNKIKDIAAAPVDFIVNTVYMGGIKKVIDAIPGVDNAPTVSFNYARGTSSVLPGYTPGKDPHQFRSLDGRMALNLSGGEGILRPEVVRGLGAGAIDFLNAAARRGGMALRKAIGALAGEPGITPSGKPTPFRAALAGSGLRSLNFAAGGAIPQSRIEAALAFARNHDSAGYSMIDRVGPGNFDCSGFMGAITNVIQNKYPYSSRGTTHSFPWSGFKPGWGQFTIGSAYPYGNTGFGHMAGTLAGVNVESAGGVGVRIGSSARGAGDPGFNEVYHLGSAQAGGGAGQGGGLTPQQLQEQRDAEKEGEGWEDFISTAKDIIWDIPAKLGDLVDMDGWGPMLRKMIGSIGDNFVQYINDKIPNEIEIPYAPNFPLPDNPIPNKFDRGGDWRSGTLGINQSGKTETVFTNRDIVDLTGDLARIANGLRAQTVDAPAGGYGSLIENLELNAPPDAVPQVLGDLTHVLRLLSLGGVHAKRLAGAPV